MRLFHEKTVYIMSIDWKGKLFHIVFNMDLSDV